MWKSHRRLLSQNFLRNELLVSRLVADSSIGKNDTVIEIGPGKGIITQALLRTACAVIGIELDNNLNSFLLKKLAENSNFILYETSFLDAILPLTPYKVFSNLPFSIEGKAIRKLIDAPNPPLDSYLVMRKELVYRLGGIDKESMFSLLYKPWFDFSIYHEFRRKDFTPLPKVPSAMLRVTKRTEPYITWKEQANYKNFIQLGFGQGQSAFRNLKQAIKHKNVSLVFSKSGVEKNTKPSFITLRQWITLYNQLHSG